MPDQTIQEIAMRKHTCHRFVHAFSVILPMAMMAGLSYLLMHSGPLFVGLLFLFVGALNFYIIESRPVVQELQINQQGIRYQYKDQLYQYRLDQIVGVLEKKIALRTRQHLQIEFDDGSILRVYTHAMRLVSLNHQPVDFKMTDFFHPGWRIWDRPVQAVRQYFIQQNLLQG